MEIRRRQNKPIKKPVQKKPRKPGSGRRPGLTRQQKIFIHEYLSSDTLDVVEAYKRAGYKGESNLNILANQVLRNPHVKAEIDRILDMRLESKRMDVYWMDYKLSQIADFDLRDCYREDGSLKSPHEMDDRTIAALKSLESEEVFAGKGEDRKQIGYTKKVTAWDKLKALELIARRKSMLSDKVQVDGELRVKAGVIVIPVPPESQEEWLRKLKDNYQKQRDMERALIGE